MRIVRELTHGNMLLKAWQRLGPKTQGFWWHTTETANTGLWLTPYSFSCPASRVRVVLENGVERVLKCK